MITIEKALNKLPYYKAEYFKWKFNLGFGSDRSLVTEEQFLKRVGRTNINVFERWRRTDEFKQLVDIYLYGKSADDLLSVYEVVSNKAKEGDSKSIDQLLKLQKEIRDNAKLANEELNAGKKKKQSKPDKDNDKQEEDDDDLIIY